MRIVGCSNGVHICDIVFHSELPTQLDEFALNAEPPEVWMNEQGIEGDGFGWLDTD
jgi:hypothetical protein